MYFQQPNMLWGLLLLAIPLLIHLFQFQRTKTLLFPGVFRLTQQLQKARHQKKLQHLWVLLSRMLAMSCIVFAFAMPSCDKNSASSKGQSHVVILVDNGFSLSCSANGVALLEQAKSQIRAILNGLNSETQVRLISQTGSSIGWLQPKELSIVIDTLTVGPQKYTLDEWTDQVQLLSEEPGVSRLAAVVFSDAQSGFMGKVLRKSQKENIDWRFVQINFNVNDLLGGNLSLDTAWYISQFSDESKSVGIQIKAKVTHRGGRASQAQLRLSMGNKTLFAQSKPISVSQTVEFEGIISISDLENPLQLSLAKDGYSYDNELYLHPIKTWSTAVGVLGSDASLDAFFLAQPMLKKRVLRLPLAQDDFAGISGLDALICVGDVRLTSKDLAGLRSKVEAGLLCLQFFQKSSSSDKLYTLLNDVIAGSWVESGQRLALPGLNHPVFRGAFSQSLAENTTLPQIDRIFKMNDNPDFETIVQLEGGDAALLYKNIENGAQWVWLSDLSMGSAKLLNSSWFLPMFTQIVASKSLQDKPLYGVLHAKQMMVLPGFIETDERGAQLLGNGGVSVVELQVNSEKNTSLYVGAEPRRPGYYQLKSPVNQSQIQLAFNWPRNESELSSDPEIAKKLLGSGLKWNASVADGKSPILQNEPLKVLWRLFLWGAAIFFAVEVLLLYFQARKKVKQNEKS